MKYAGFNIATLAHNHFYDYGNSGVVDTLDSCRENNIEVVGEGVNLEEPSCTFYKDLKGVRFAFINCCEHEFSIATDKTGGSNPLNPIKQFYAIEEAKKNADRVIVIVHGGHEHYQLPSPRMKETYRFFVDAGADVVINHHQHCYSGYEVYNDKPIFYGLGNFCFDNLKSRNSIWNEDYMLVISFEQNHIGYELIPYTQCNETPSVELVKNRSDFDKSIEKLNGIIQDTMELKKQVDEYCRSTTVRMLIMHQPYENRILNKLYCMHLLPSLVSKKRFLYLLNYIDCESHHDKHVFILKQLFEK